MIIMDYFRKETELLSTLVANYFDTDFNSNKYSLLQVKSWRDENNYFKNMPNFRELTVAIHTWLHMNRAVVTCKLHGSVISVY